MTDIATFQVKFRVSGRASEADVNQAMHVVDEITNEQIEAAILKLVDEKKGGPALTVSVRST